MKTIQTLSWLTLAALLCGCEPAQQEPVDPSLVTVTQGLIKGQVDARQQVVSFKGIPYAKAPINERRWQAPQPAEAWQGLLHADQFGNQCMQLPLFSDMQFRSSGVSEDCLFLNVWMPFFKPNNNLPVLVYFYGGGFVAGDGSEKRYDGAAMAAKGMITVTVNYRLGLFGFLAHPQLSAESAYQGSGNYGLLDQQAALAWVAQNISQFGGDPSRITIAGESAGSISATSHMLAKDSIPYLHGVIAESGSIMGNFLTELAVAEQQGVDFVKAIAPEADNIASLRAMPAEELLNKAKEAGQMWFRPTIDGKFLTARPSELIASQQFAQVPLLAGVNSQEGSYQQLFKGKAADKDNYLEGLRELYPEHYQQISEIYPADGELEYKLAAQALMSDRFISRATWNFVDAVTQHSQAPTYYYYYDHVRPPLKPELREGQGDFEILGALHSAEIEYALGNLAVNPMYQWQDDDYRLSALMQEYFANFIKQGDPNGQDLANWPRFAEGQQMVLKLPAAAQSTNELRSRYDKLSELGL